MNTCKAGYYCPQGSAYPIKCDPGYACPSNLMSEADLLDCEVGYYCPEGSTSTQQNICPIGHFCPINSNLPTPCPRGTYSPDTGLTALSECTTCSVGSYCEKAALSAPTGTCAAGYYCKDEHYVARPEAEQCPAGYSCGVGSIDKTQCTTGYQDRILQESCKSCPEGYYCPEVGGGSTDIISKVMCDPSADSELSFYCPADDLDITYCDAGYYSMSMLSKTAASDCIACPPGFFCTNTAGDTKFQSCPEGYICAEGAAAGTDEICVEGFYCPAGYSAMLYCPPGQYCDATGLAAPTGDCDEGYYCNEGSKTATPTDGTQGSTCDYGHYCPVGSGDPIACDIGMYLNLRGSTDVANCTNCTDGYLCSDLGLQTPSQSCPEGYYCEFDASNNNQLELPCPPGFKCPAGVYDKINCLSGTYQYYSNKGSCTTCPERYYCMKNDSDATEILSEPTICPAGKYCASGTATTGVDCPAGTYSAQQGLATSTECESCPGGYYCTGGGSAPDDICADGYYCLGGASTATPTDTVTGDICPTGHYCPAGSYKPTKCPKGTVNDDTGDAAVADCEACAAGFYCPYLGATTTTIDYSSNTFKCDEGYICLGGSIKPYGDDGTIAMACSTGKYCPKGSTVEIDCPLGTYNPSIAGGSCTACPKGKV